jgi:hypothetical protein
MYAMSARAISKRVHATATVVVLAGLLAAAFLIGRFTAPPHGGSWAEGNAVGYDEGVSVGRALQVGASLPADTKDAATKAFKAGYQAGLTDSFGSYDGGWSLGQPYVVVIEKGVGDAPYRIDQRELLQPGVTYRVCKSAVGVCAG